MGISGKGSGMGVAERARDGVDSARAGGGGAGSHRHDLEHTGVGGRQEEAEERALGEPGRPLHRRNPFYIGLTGALGVAVAYVLFRAVSDVGEVLALIGLALFLAVGLDPAVVWLTGRGLPRWAAVIVVLLALLAVVAGFVASAVGPIGREAHQLQVNIPRWENDVKTGKGWIGHLAKEFHLASELKSKKVTKLVSPTEVAGGVLGAGKVLVTAVSAVVVWSCSPSTSSSPCRPCACSGCA